MTVNSANIAQLLNGEITADQIDYLTPIASMALYAMVRSNCLNATDINLNAQIAEYARWMNIDAAFSQPDIRSLSDVNYEITPKGDYFKFAKVDCRVAGSRQVEAERHSIAISKSLVPNPKDRIHYDGLRRSIFEGLLNVHDHNQKKVAAVQFQRSLSAPDGTEFKGPRDQVCRFALFSPGDTLRSQLWIASGAEHPVDDEVAAKVSLLPRFSSKTFYALTEARTQNEGLGLFVMMRLGAALGRFVLVSGNVCVTAEGNHPPAFAILRHHLQGVLISVDALERNARETKVQRLSGQISQLARAARVPSIAHGDLNQLAAQSDEMQLAYLAKEQTHLQTENAHQES